MSFDVLIKGMLVLGFVEERNDEYHRTCYTNTEYDYRGKNTSIEVQIDYYNVRLIWHYKTGRKVSSYIYADAFLKLPFSSAKDFVDITLDNLKEKYLIE